LVAAAQGYCVAPLGRALASLQVFEGAPFGFHFLILAVEFAQDFPRRPGRGAIPPQVPDQLLPVVFVVASVSAVALFRVAEGSSEGAVDPGGFFVFQFGPAFAVDGDGGGIIGLQLERGVFGGLLGERRRPTQA